MAYGLKASSCNPLKGVIELRNPLFGYDDRSVVSKEQKWGNYIFILMDEQTIYFRQNILPSVLSELS